MSRLTRILGRRAAYRRMFFDGEGRLTRDAEVVIADLKRYCRWDTSTTVISPVSRQTDVPASFQAEGRREVLARILSHLHVSDADIQRITERMDNEY